MKAVVRTTYGSPDVLELQEIEKPELVDDGVLRDLLEAGNVTPVVDRRYELSDVADAFRYLGEGHARGKIVITV